MQFVEHSLGTGILVLMPWFKSQSILQGPQQQVQADMQGPLSRIYRNLAISNVWGIKGMKNVRLQHTNPPSPDDVLIEVLSLPQVHSEDQNLCILTHLMMCVLLNQNTSTESLFLRK